MNRHPPRTRQQEQARITVAKTELRSGPLPSAEEMKQYAAVLPDLPQRILQMAEAEQKHRFEIDEGERRQRAAELRANSILTGCGIFASIFCVALTMAAVAWCARFGHAVSAGVIGSGGLGVIVVALIYGAKIRSGGEGPGQQQ